MGLINKVDMVCLSPVGYGVLLTFRALALRRSRQNFHIIVPVAPVFANYVQTTGTIIWKHHGDDRGRSKKTGATAIAWIEKYLSGRPKRSRENVNVLMATTFGRLGRPKNISQCTVFSPLCSKNGCVNRIFFLKKTKNVFWIKCRNS